MLRRSHPTSGPRWLRPWWAVASSVALMISAACAEIGDPYLGEGVSGPSTTIAVEADASGAAPAQEVVSANVSPVFAPSRPDDYTPLILASTSTALFTFDGETLTDFGALFAGQPIVAAVDDYLGGVVVQLEGNVIQWLPASAEQGTLVSQGNGSLLDAGFLDASLAVQVFLAVPNGVDRIKLVDGTREPFVRLGEGEEIVAFSASNGIQAMAISNAECGALRFANALGQEVDLPGPTAPSCPVERRPRYGAVAMSPDGGSVAYTEVTYRGDGLPASTQLIALELNTRALLLSETIGGPGEQIESLAYDGRRLTYLRTGENGREVALLAVTEGGESVVPGLAGVQQVTFARLPLALAPVPTLPEPDATTEPGVEPPEDEGQP